MDFFTKQRITGFFIVLLIVLNLGTLATLWIHYLRRPVLPPPPAGNRAGNVQHFLEKELNLSSEQAQKFKELRKKNVSETKTIIDEISQIKKQLSDEVFNTEPDTAKLERLAGEIGAQQAELERRRYRHFLELKSICNEDQQKKFMTIFNNTFEMMGPPDGLGRPGQRKPSFGRDQMEPGNTQFGPPGEFNQPRSPGMRRHPEDHRPPRGTESQENDESQGDK